MAKPGGSFASQKIQLLCSAKDELQSLEGTVQTIQAVLLDAEKQQWHNNELKLRLKRLNDVLCELQDLLDDVATEDLRWKVTSGNKMSKAVCVFFSKSNQLAYRFKVANKIQELRKKLDQIKNDQELNLERHLSEETLSIVRRTTHSFACEEEIIGREEDKKEIIAHLLHSSSRESVSVVSIVSIGGLGKTTLADLVHNDENVKECFKLKMRVCHGDPKIFDVDLIIKEILKSAKYQCQEDPEMNRNLEGIENISKDQLRRLLRKVLDRKKYLLVLDDLWNDDRQRWLELRPLLMGGSRGSKILITTRNQSVVQATDANSVIHDLHGLYEDKSWELFKKLAFGDGEESLDSKLEEIGRDIVKKCAGVPLAIKTMGSLLYAKNEKEWLKFKEHELSKIDKSEHEIMEVLKLSYDHLPLHLKHGFAYCALFPKDYVFDKQTMIQLWMAQGFIESLEGNEDLEETGDSYVSDLLDRSFLEFETVDDYTGEVKMFKMHDPIHDLALRVAGDECKMVNLNEGGICEGIRHASFVSQSSSPQDVTSILEPNNLRTFLALKESKTFVQNGILSKFRHCRVLVLGYAHFGIPTSLGSRSKHLRFLDISENQSMESMPNSIIDLVNLHTLKLSNCKNLKTLPRDLKKLVNLRHLLINGCDSLSHLPSLSEFPSLRTLNLMGLDALEFLQEISYPEHSNTRRPLLPISGETIPPRLSQPKRMVGKTANEYLNIASAELLEQVMAVLDCPSKAPVESTFIPLSKLKGLHFAGGDLEHSMLETLLPVNTPAFFSVRAYVSFIKPDQAMWYRACKTCKKKVTEAIGSGYWCEGCQKNDEGCSLRFRQLPKLVTLPEGIQHVTTLQFLRIECCENLMSLPGWIGNFSSLELLEIIGCKSLRSFPEGIVYVTNYWEKVRVIGNVQLMENIF
ncbi:disease resistance protein RGA2-like [Syzygium oleosum]|uniref:disease resistance protein RGA2-like n=1 Tax=Syzygium oleosum TaxID=219896 RepID=UPI0024B9950C|nr:disease resistance protein RGA2-like [Syzygium oleosum]